MFKRYTATQRLSVLIFQLRARLHEKNSKFKKKKKIKIQNKILIFKTSTFFQKISKVFEKI